MESSCSPTVARIDLDALRHNLKTIQGLIAPHQSLLAVVKADAYGHGAVPVAQCLAEQGVRHFGVARVDEGVELRNAGIEGSILVMGGVFPGQEEALLQADLTPSLFELSAAHRIHAVAAGNGRSVPYHLEIDTGMSRVGFLPEQLSTVMTALDGLPALRFEGAFSHFAVADEPHNDVTMAQKEAFRLALDQLEQLGHIPREVHLSNSAGILTAPMDRCTLVRPGISLYGSAPSNELAPKLDLRPVMSFETQIAHLQRLPAGVGVSYGHRFVTARETQLASLPVGYADGMSRGLSHQVEVLIRGVRVPIVGTICMDWVVADVTDLPEVALGDRAILLGTEGDEAISAEEWAEILRTISYEVYCQIGKRVPRIHSTKKRA